MIAIGFSWWVGKLSEQGGDEISDLSGGEVDGGSNRKPYAV